MNNRVAVLGAFVLAVATTSSSIADVSTTKTVEVVEVINFLTVAVRNNTDHDQVITLATFSDGQIVSRFRQVTVPANTHRFTVELESTVHGGFQFDTGCGGNRQLDVEYPAPPHQLWPSAAPVRPMPARHLALIAFVRTFHAHPFDDEAWQAARQLMF